MIRSFFASILLTLFAVVAVPLLIVGILFSTFLNPDYLKNQIVPGSYELALGALTKRFEKEMGGLFVFRSG